RARIRIRPEQAEILREARLREELERAGAFYVSGLQVEKEETARLRLHLGEVERLTPLELLERYLESRNIGPERRARLIERARRIVAETEG
ncbi:MAG: hypothetical protein C4314_05720, partial [Thermoflexus sp.]